MIWFSAYRYSVLAWNIIEVCCLSESNISPFLLSKYLDDIHIVKQHFGYSLAAFWEILLANFKLISPLQQKPWSCLSMLSVDKPHFFPKRCIPKRSGWTQLSLFRLRCLACLDLRNKPPEAILGSTTNSACLPAACVFLAASGWAHRGEMTAVVTLRLRHETLIILIYYISQ